MLGIEAGDEGPAKADEAARILALELAHAEVLVDAEVVEEEGAEEQEGVSVGRWLSFRYLRADFPGWLSVHTYLKSTAVEREGSSRIHATNSASVAMSLTGSSPAPSHPATRAEI